MKGRNRGNKQLDNHKLRNHFVNLFTVGGGATLYTLWQIRFPLTNDVPYYSNQQQAFIMSISVTMILIGIILNKK